MRAPLKARCSVSSRTSKMRRRTCSTCMGAALTASSCPSAVSSGEGETSVYRVGRATDEAARFKAVA